MGFAFSRGVAPLVMRALMVVSAPAQAVLLKATLADFAPTDTLIDFEGLAHAEPINTQFSSLGATFSDG